MGEGQPGQCHAAVRQLHQGVTLTAQGGPEAVNGVGRLAITEIVRLQQQTQALKGVHVVPDESPWTEVSGSSQNRGQTNTIRGRGQVEIL